MDFGHFIPPTVCVCGWLWTIHWRWRHRNDRLVTVTKSLTVMAMDRLVTVSRSRSTWRGSAIWFLFLLPFCGCNFRRRGFEKKKRIRHPQPGNVKANQDSRVSHACLNLAKRLASFYFSPSSLLIESIKLCKKEKRHYIHRCCRPCTSSSCKRNEQLIGKKREWRHLSFRSFHSRESRWLFTWTFPGQIGSSTKNFF